jgi:hypothetical protein
MHGVCDGLVRFAGGVKCGITSSRYARNLRGGVWQGISYMRGGAISGTLSASLARALCVRVRVRVRVHVCVCVCV